MKEILIRGLSGLIYILLLITCIHFQHAIIILFFIFGIICMGEFKKLIELKSYIPYIIFVVLYGVFGYWQLIVKSKSGISEATQILMVITIFVNLFLIKDRSFF